MRISTLAKLSGLSIDTVRFYEKQGLLNERHYKRLPNNYRSYNEAALRRLKLIKSAKQFGFTLSEFKENLGDADETDKCDNHDQHEEMLRQKLAEVNIQIQEMEVMKNTIQEQLTALREAKV